MNIGNENGSALLLTIVVTFVLLFMGGALATYNLLEKRQVQREEANTQAYFIARSGADALAQAIIDNPARVGEFIGTFDPITLGNGTFSVEAVDEGDVIKVVSTGFVGGSQRMVSLELKKETMQPVIEQAIFASGMGTSSEPAIRLEGSAKIVGTAGTNSTNPKSVQLEWSTKIENGDLLVGPGVDPSTVVRVAGENNNPPRTVADHLTSGYGLTNLARPVEFVLPVFPNFPNSLAVRPNFVTDWKEGLDYRISEDGYYDTINVTSGRTLKIDLQGGTRILRVKDFLVGGNITLINVAPNGRLILYVDQRFRMGGNWNVNYSESGSKDPNILTIYYAGSNTFGDAQFNFCGNVVVKDAPVKIGSGSKFAGSLLSLSSKPILIDGAAMATTGVIYAPKAKVTVSGSAQTGAIVAKSLLANGSATVVFDRNLPTDLFPEEIFSDFSGATTKYSRGFWSENRGRGM